MKSHTLALLLAILSLAGPRLAQDDATFQPIRFGDSHLLSYDAPFFPDATYDPAITTPDHVLGQKHGTRLSHHAEILECFRRWAEESPRVVLASHGRTHEGRELVHAVVTSPANHARLEAIKANLARLHDPRDLSAAAADALVADTPAVAWMGYSIHGDEVSGCDAALALGYHLAASRDEDVRRLLEHLVVVIDPVMNPDGRERIIGMVEQSAGRTTNLDYESMHRGRWPFGRGNHYLFDMNRDWIAGTQPETRGRWQAINEFHPQLLVDAHEMGALDTFLFYPQAAPLHPHLAAKHLAWQRTFAEGAAAAFDAHGWTYYTREWADGWGPFYTDAWASLSGATGILYEQAGTSGSPLRRASGRVLTYREAVHHQTVASWANLTTLSARREEALRDYLANKRRNVSSDAPFNDRMFVVRPTPNLQRLRELVRILAGQGIEVFQTPAPLTVRNAVGHLGARAEELELPAGSLVVPVRQPMRQLMLAYLELDPRMDAEALRLERRDLERKGETRIYDLTSWALPFALDLDAWWCDARELDAVPIAGAASVEPELSTRRPEGDPVAWMVDGTDDASVAFAARALELGLAVHLTEEPAGDPELPAGSLLVRVNENEGTWRDIQERVVRAARGAGVTRVHVAKTSLATGAAPDLGGQKMHLLARPRIGLLANAPIAPDTFGHLWHHLDQVLGVPFTLIEAQQLGGYDLRRINVLVLPPHWGGLDAILAANAEALRSWVAGGGTLVAIGNSAAAVTNAELGLTDVVLRRDALEELDAYAVATRREWDAREIEVDEAALWGESDAAAPQDGAEASGADADDEGVEGDEGDAEAAEVDEDQDAWLRTFSPYGVTLRGIVRPGEWITAGCGEELPVYVTGSSVFLSKPPVRTPIRLAPKERLRLGGLVWPEARERLAESAWLTVESSGSGQVILFAAMPGFRGYQRATARLFANAVVYGPGVGASQPIAW